MVARAFPPYEDWTRLSLGLPEEMAVAHKALRVVLGGEAGAVADAETMAAAAAKLKEDAVVAARL